MIALLALLAATPVVSPGCAGIVLRQHGRPLCVAAPPLQSICAALRACATDGYCVITVTGRVTKAAYRSSEAWGDWLDRLRSAPARAKLSAATVETLGGGPRTALPYTLIVAPGRPPRYSPGLWLDALPEAADPPGIGRLRAAPRDSVRRLCPELTR